MLNKPGFLIVCLLLFLAFHASGQGVAVIDTLVASSYLTEPYDYFAYHPVKMFDGNPQTFWFENRRGPGIGETITIKFKNPVTIDEIRLMPGCFLEEYFIRNNRVRSIEIRQENGRTITHQFRDFMTEQSLLTNDPVALTEITIRILDVYKTTEYDDTAISEISFYNQGARLKVDVSKMTSIIAAQPKAWQNITLTPRQVGELWGFADPTGSFPIPAVFERVYPFKSGRALVTGDGRAEMNWQYDQQEFMSWYCVDKRGTQITVPSFVMIRCDNPANSTGDYDYFVGPEQLNGKWIFSMSASPPLLSQIAITPPPPQNHQIMVALGKDYTYMNMMNYLFFPDGTCRLIGRKYGQKRKPQFEEIIMTGKWVYRGDLIYITWEHRIISSYMTYTTYRDETAGNCIVTETNIYRHETIDWLIFYSTARGSVMGELTGGPREGILYEIWDHLFERSEGGR